MSKTLKRKTFRALMAYLNPIGSIGTNVNMWADDIEYLPPSWVTFKNYEITLLNIFKDFIQAILKKYGNDFYNNTDKNEPIYWVDVVVNPVTRSIILTPRYFSFSEVKENRRCDWRELKDYYPISKFMEDRDLEEVTIDYSGFEYNFDFKIIYDNKELNMEDTMFFKHDIRGMIGEILEDIDWNVDTGGKGVLKLFNENNDGYLYHIWINKSTTSGDTIILKEEDFD
jgi:hypothetical protein